MLFRVSGKSMVCILSENQISQLCGKMLELLFIQVEAYNSKVTISGFLTVCCSRDLNFLGANFFFQGRKIHILWESILSTYDFLTACSLESLFSHISPQCFIYLCWYRVSKFEPTLLFRNLQSQSIPAPAASARHVLWCSALTCLFSSRFQTKTVWSDFDVHLRVSNEVFGLPFLADCLTSCWCYQAAHATAPFHPPSVTNGQNHSDSSI